MEFQQLEMFAALVEEGSVTQAAERVCRTPPAVSIAIRKLEEEMGVALFDRSERHHQRLTASGELLYSYATRLLHLRQEAIGSIKELRGHSQTLRLGTHESTSLYLLPSLMQAINLDHAGIKTEIVCGTTDDLLKALENRSLELALIGDAPDDRKFVRHLIKRDEMILITNPSHRLADMKEVQVEDLAGELLIVQERKSRLRTRIIKALQESRIRVELGVENVAIEAIKRMVAEGQGIGFVPRMCVSEEAANGKLRTISVSNLVSEWDISMVYLRDRSLSSAARAFVKSALQFRDEAKDSAICESDNTNSKALAQPQGSTRIGPRKVIHC